MTFIPILASENSDSSCATVAIPELRLGLGGQSLGRGWVALQLELAVAIPGRQLVLATTGQRHGPGQGWRCPS